MKLLLTALSALMIYSIQTLACDGGCSEGHGKEMSAEDRTKMADMHAKMSECLKDKAKPMEECHKMMMEMHPHKGDHKSCGGHEGKMHGKKHHDEKQDAAKTEVAPAAQPKEEKK